jgi:hypothetical protein
LELFNSDYQKLLKIYLPVIYLIEDQSLQKEANDLITELGLIYTLDNLPEVVDDVIDESDNKGLSIKLYH